MPDFVCGPTSHERVPSGCAGHPEYDETPWVGAGRWGSIALTAESVVYTTARSGDPGIDIGSRVFLDPIPGATALSVTDFEVIDTGPRIAETVAYVRSDEPLDGIFRDGFEQG